eukprot:CAMPEP_0195257198 /NCGR_PEP_ID=MMETSP0706-20130129/6679_1 /TAXON_ID=33640 /ORGANISM="Asterionellopsis glacialis, Strain CCMP134" /LENGTH=180 /DNA_ID=CAMNT_0040310367 /DNA_START=201 /DNA_END=743 /DNA_ORIENTATION=+
MTKAAADEKKVSAGREVLDVVVGGSVDSVGTVTLPKVGAGTGCFEGERLGETEGAIAGVGLDVMLGDNEGRPLGTEEGSNEGIGDGAAEGEPRNLQATTLPAVSPMYSMSPCSFIENSELWGAVSGIVQSSIPVFMSRAYTTPSDSVTKTYISSFVTTAELFTNEVVSISQMIVMAVSFR